MQEIHIAKDFFKAHLPKELQTIMNWNSLQLQPGSFIDTDYASAYTDVLYRVNIDSKPSYLYLLAEHQSTPDELMPLRLWRYMCRIWDQHSKQEGKKKGKLPLIYPVTLYHGKQTPYPYLMDFFDLFDKPSQAKSLLLKPFRLIDLTTTEDDILTKHSYAAAMELIQKHIFRKNLLPIIKRLADEGFLQLIRHLDCGEYTLKLIDYSLEKGEFSSADEIIELFIDELPDQEERIMTGAEQLMQRGREQGMQQGMQQGKQEGLSKAKVDIAKNMLSLGVKAEIVRQSTGLSEEELTELC
jgi:predicted transposase/invertase (TIGR01784 family)